MKVKHLKTKTVIELAPQELDKYAEYLKELDSATTTLHECGDLFLSDLTKLDNLEWRHRDLLGLKLKDYKYIKENYSD